MKGIYGFFLSYKQLYPKKDRKESSDYPDSDDDNEDDDDDGSDDDDDAPTPVFTAPPIGGALLGFGTPLFGATT